MHFPLKLALSAILAKHIAADVSHLSQSQKFSNELDSKYAAQEFGKQGVSF